MGKKVQIYTTNTCAYCNAVKQFLDDKGQGYEVINLDEDPDKIEDFKKLTDVMVVPLVTIADEDDAAAAPTIVQGWDPIKLGEALAA